jgi:UDP-glucose 4-epimerase
MRIVITGGAGFIGAHSARALLAAGHEVHVADDLSHGKREAVPAGATLHVVDVRAPALLELLGRLRPEAVLHLAAQMDVRRSVADPAEDASINVLGTVTALEAARRAGARRFVFASSGGAIYGSVAPPPTRENAACAPDSPYGVSKLCGEHYLELYERAHGLSCLALRYANVYGPGQDPHGEAGVVAIFLQRMLAGTAPVINGDGLQTRDYVFVEDVVRANVLALQSKQRGALNVGTGRETNVVEIAQGLARHAGFTRPVTHGPGKPGEQRRSALDASAAREALGWSPRMDLDEGLALTVQSFRKG